MLDITLRELWWKAWMVVRRWRYRLWPSKDTSAAGVRVINLDDQWASLHYNVPTLRLWHDIERVPVHGMAAPNSAESED
jgi:hypothetical protein